MNRLLLTSALLIGTTRLGAAESDPELESVVRAVAPKANDARNDTLEASDLAGAESVPEALARVPGIHLQDEQGNPLQVGLSMRGSLVGPVTGVSQGVVVLVDGIRVNEPTAGEVNFELLPLAAVERIEVTHGPDAILGSNALGGAINIITRRGEGAPGATLSLDAGSFGEVRLRAVGGGRVGPFDAFVAVTGFADRGFRPGAAAQSDQAFMKVGYRTASRDLTLSYELQRDRIEEPGSLPLSLLERHRRQTYTAGDFFAPWLHFLVLDDEERLSDSLTLAAHASLRALSVEQFNSNAIGDNTRLFSGGLSPSGGVSLTQRWRSGRIRNRLTLTAAYAYDDVRVRVFDEPPVVSCATLGSCSSSRLGADLTDHEQTASGAVEDSLRFGSGVFGASDSVTFVIAARIDQIVHRIDDQTPDSPGKASGSAHFTRLSPALTLSYSPRPGYAVAVTYAAGFRAPAFLELTCASPDSPCIGLQAGVAPDTGFKALAPVTAQSFELGLTAAPGAGIEGKLSLFRTDLGDDLLSLTGTTATSVYFQNVGSTRRQGLEASVQSQTGPVTGTLGYTYTQATFEDALALATPRTPGESETVRRGSTLPLSPRHRVDLDLEWAPTGWLELSTDLAYVGRQYLRGDEANSERELDAYTVLGLGARATYDTLTASLRVFNALNARYATFGTFATNVRAPASPVEPFLTPGPPLRVLVGLSYRID